MGDTNVFITPKVGHSFMLMQDEKLGNISTNIDVDVPIGNVLGFRMGGGTIGNTYADQATSVLQGRFGLFTSLKIDDSNFNLVNHATLEYTNFSGDHMIGANLII